MASKGNRAPGATIHGPNAMVGYHGLKGLVAKNRGETYHPSNYASGDRGGSAGGYGLPHGASGLGGSDEEGGPPGVYRGELLFRGEGGVSGSGVGETLPSMSRPVHGMPGIEGMPSHGSSYNPREEFRGETEGPEEWKRNEHEWKAFTPSELQGSSSYDRGDAGGAHGAGQGIRGAFGAQTWMKSHAPQSKGIAASAASTIAKAMTKKGPTKPKKFTPTKPQAGQTGKPQASKVPGKAAQAVSTGTAKVGQETVSKTPLITDPGF